MHRGTIRSTYRSVPPTRCHPFPAISSGKGGICFARAHTHTYIRMTAAKGRRNGRRSVMRKPRAIKSHVCRRRCKYHLFPSLPRVMQLTYECIMHECARGRPDFRTRPSSSCAAREPDKGVTRSYRGIRVSLIYTQRCICTSLRTATRPTTERIYRRHCSPRREMCIVTLFHR